MEYFPPDCLSAFPSFSLSFDPVDLQAASSARYAFQAIVLVPAPSGLFLAFSPFAERRPLFSIAPADLGPLMLRQKRYSVLDIDKSGPMPYNDHIVADLDLDISI